VKEEGERRSFREINLIVEKNHPAERKKKQKQHKRRKEKLCHKTLIHERNKNFFFSLSLYGGVIGVSFGFERARYRLSSRKEKKGARVSLSHRPRGKKRGRDPALNGQQSRHDLFPLMTGKGKGKRR